MQMAFDLTDLEAQLTLERKKVDVSSHDFSVRELVRMLSDGELSITPEYQRKYRWKPEVASTFIESIFLGLPIPPIFVATNEGFQWEVVDGLQRLSSLLYFVATDPATLEIVSRSSSLKLAELQKLTQLNGLTYQDLPSALQIYFGRQPLQVISLTDKSDANVRFDLFERLNAGAIALSPQEVRACIYRGKFNAFIEDKSTDEAFLSLLKLQESNKHDGTSVEQVLKFFAYKNHRAKFDGKVKSFLNNYMGDSVKAFDYEREGEIFDRAVSWLSEVTDGGPFLRPNNSITPLVQLEACLVAAGEIYGQGAVPVAPGTGWIEDTQLVGASTGGSNTRAKLDRRITRAKELFGVDG
jgi:hypothetical protein